MEPVESFHFKKFKWLISGAVEKRAEANGMCSKILLLVCHLELKGMFPPLNQGYEQIHLAIPSSIVKGCLTVFCSRRSFSTLPSDVGPLPLGPSDHPSILYLLLCIVTGQFPASPTLDHKFLITELLTSLLFLALSIVFATQ